MEIKFSSDLSIEDFEDGKIIMDIETMESYYIEQGVFDLLAPALDEYRDARSLFPEIYEEEEYLPFLQDLIDKRILIRK